MTPLFLLHGFTGSADAWDDVVRRLPKDVRAVRATIGGHDGTPAPSSFEHEVDRLAEAIRAAGAVGAHVCGYSLGGRLATGLVARHAALLSGATIVSANPGLASDAERAPRAEADEKWAQLIERDVSAFVDKWEAQPLFATQLALSPEEQAAQRARRLRHDPKGLAGAMRALSLARMPYYAPELAGVDLPITVVTGGSDAKFTDIAARLVPTLRRGTHLVVAGAGHNVMLERPDAIAEVLARALVR